MPRRISQKLFERLQPGWGKDYLEDMTLKEAFGIRTGEVVSLIGAGGKTTTLYHLAKEVYDEGGKALVTTTTKIFKPTKPHVQRLFLVQEVEALLKETKMISPPVIIAAGAGIDDAGKLIGLPAEWFRQINASGQFDAVLIEADGAASRLLKVPSEYEPVVPSECTLAIWVVAIKVLGRPLDTTSVHRFERAMALLDIKEGTPISLNHIIQLVRNPSGCLKGIPSGSRKVALINQADSPEEIERARELGHALIQLGIERAVITSYLDQDPVKALITA